MTPHDYLIFAAIVVFVALIGIFIVIVCSSVEGPPPPPRLPMLLSPWLDELKAADPEWWDKLSGGDNIPSALDEFARRNPKHHFSLIRHEFI